MQNTGVDVMHDGGGGGGDVDDVHGSSDDCVQNTEGVDVNARTLDSLLPEETTTNKTVIRMVRKARLQLTGM